MKTCEPITIVGGGLAGLALGIALRQQSVPVTVWEAGGYPRHRVCGEFISGRGLRVLDRLGLTEKLNGAGAREACTARFCTTHRVTPNRTLPQPALCVSRFTLDAFLAEEFKRLGGELREHSKWTHASAEAGTVRATGRSRHTGEQGQGWFGLKVHVSGVRLDTDLEMHLQPGGYVGLCRLSGGKVNVCGLFLRQACGGSKHATGWREHLRGVPGSPLHERLRQAQFDPDSFCAVAGLDLHPQRARGRDECVIGDALTMIPPLTGNGMSMAFEAAGLSAPHLREYCAQRVTWAEAQRRMAADLDRRFAPRLRWAAWAQRLILHPNWGSRLMVLSLRSGVLWRHWFVHTR